MMARGLAILSRGRHPRTSTATPHSRRPQFLRDNLRADALRNKLLLQIRSFAADFLGENGDA